MWPLPHQEMLSGPFVRTQALPASSITSDLSHKAQKVLDRGVAAEALEPEHQATLQNAAVTLGESAYPGPFLASPDPEGRTVRLEAHRDALEDQETALLHDSKEALQGLIKTGESGTGPAKVLTEAQPLRRASMSRAKRDGEPLSAGGGSLAQVSATIEQDPTLAQLLPPPIKRQHNTKPQPEPRSLTPSYCLERVEPTDVGPRLLPPPDPLRTSLEDVQLNSWQYHNKAAADSAKATADDLARGATAREEACKNAPPLYYGC